MWLSDANERKLLSIYFNRARARFLEKGHSPIDTMTISFIDLVAAFDSKAALDLDLDLDLDRKPENLALNPLINMKARKHSKSPDNKYARFLDCLTRIFSLNYMLRERNLLSVGTQKLNYIGELSITLNPRGYDLGEKYSQFWPSLHLRWIEYKDSFLWPIIGFLVGSIMTYILLKVTSK